MSIYTTELRFICESLCGLNESVGYTQTNDVIKQAAPLIFDFDYPIFDENYRTVLQNKIIKHYYTREIGLETFGLWKLKLDTKLNEIMPYYNELYKTTLYEFNPLYDVDYYRTRDITDNGTQNDTRNTNVDRNETFTNTGTETTNYNRNTTNTGTITTENSGNTTTDNSGTQKTETETNNTQTNDLSREMNNNTTFETKRDINDEIKNKFSDTPQNALLVESVEGDTYLTNYQLRTNTNGTTGNDTTEGTQTETNTGTVDNSGTTDTTVTNNLSTTITENTKQKTTNDTTQQYGGNDTLELNRTNTGKGTYTTTDRGNKSINNVQKYIEHVSGKMSPTLYATAIAEFRKTLLNIDMLIINDLEDLFMLVY